MASRRSEQQENAQLRIMRLLSINPKISTRTLAAEVGISNGSAYYVLKALVEKGFVKLESFNNNPRKSVSSLIFLLFNSGFLTRKYIFFTVKLTC